MLGSNFMRARMLGVAQKVAMRHGTRVAVLGNHCMPIWLSRLSSLIAWIETAVY